MSRRSSSRSGTNSNKSGKRASKFSGDGVIQKSTRVSKAREDTSEGNYTASEMKKKIETVVSRIREGDHQDARIDQLTRDYLNWIITTDTEEGSADQEARNESIQMLQDLRSEYGFRTAVHIEKIDRIAPVEPVAIIDERDE